MIILGYCSILQGFNNTSPYSLLADDILSAVVICLLVQNRNETSELKKMTMDAKDFKLQDENGEREESSYDYEDDEIFVFI